MFATMSVQKITLGAYTRKIKLKSKRDIDEVCVLFHDCANVGNQAAGTMSGGEQQCWRWSRDDEPNPRLLLLDEYPRTRGAGERNLQRRATHPATSGGSSR